MEMKKLHLGTMSFGSDTMDEVVHQLNTAFGVDGEPGRFPTLHFLIGFASIRCDSCQTRFIVDWRAVGHSWSPRHVRANT
jgi:LSD1 subclass zinc finger protein